MIAKKSCALLLVLAGASFPIGCGDDPESSGAGGGNAGTSTSDAGMPGSTEGGASAGGASGGAPSDGGSAGAASGGGPAMQPNDCADYAAVWCGGLVDCAPLRITRDYEDEAGCVEVVSARCATEIELGYPIADFAGCIETLSGGDCDEVLSDLSGACQHERGTKAAGEPCIDNGECNSGICLFSGTPCGECTELAEVGDPCSNAGVSCTAPGLTCDLVSEECAEIELGGVGAPCGESQTEQCRPDLVCSEGECAEPLGEGEDCTLEPGRCDLRRWLTCTENECLPFGVVGLGESCGADWPFPRCSDYAYCDPEMLECMPRQGLNEDCAEDPVAGSTCLPRLSCVDGTCVDPTEGCLD